MANEFLIPGGGVFIKPSTSGEYLLPGGGIVSVEVETPEEPTPGFLVNPRSELIREPNLLIPGKKPVGAVKVNLDHSFAPDGYWLCNERGGNRLRNIGRHIYAPDFIFGSATTWGWHPQGIINVNTDSVAASSINSIYSETNTWFEALSESPYTVIILATILNDATAAAQYLFGFGGGSNGLYIYYAVGSDQTVLVAGLSGANTLNNVTDWYNGDKVQSAISVKENDITSYHNGKAEDTDTVTGSMITSANVAANIGHIYTGSSGRRFCGIIHSVYIKRRNMSAKEIVDLSLDPYQFLVPA